MGVKAWFRATREMVGLSQQDVALAMGVSVRSVKRWENPEADGSSIPQEAVDWMGERLMEFGVAVDNALDVIDELPEGLERMQLTYYRDQAQHDIFGRGLANYAMVNAISRAVAAECMVEGIEVDWAYPTDPDKVPTP